ncbi:MAG TPA: hypothetical protein VMV25_02450 [Steroidobacteraceae bacterium]|nr:hypothetical protein [Steroidobacteraceae bacterium]
MPQFSRGALLPLLLVAMAAHAAGYPPPLFGGLHWRLVGPFRGGRALAVSGVPGQPLRWYFGAVDGGVWETRDAGRTWAPIFDGEPVASIGALAVAPSNPRVIYVGTGEADMRSDIAQGRGIYKSVDGGRTWSHLGLDDSRQIAAILVDPQNADIAYAAALGDPYGPNACRGVFATSDGGKTWRKVLYRGADTGAISLAFQPGNSRVIYAALWQTRRPPWNVYPPSEGPGSGLYKSLDAGAHWRKISGAGFPAAPGRIGIALSPAAPQRVYAIVDGDAGGLYRSDDGGAHWLRASADPRIWQRGWYFGQIAVDPTNADHLWAMNTIVLRSTDGGRTFLAQKGDATGDDYHELWIDPEDAERRILGTDQGVLITLNGGKTWSSWFNQPTAQIYHVATDERFPYDLYGAQQDSGAVMLPSRTISGDGIAMPQFHELVAGGESDMIAPDPKNPDIVYGGRVDRLDRRTQQTRSVDPMLAHPQIARATWTLPLVFSPKDPRRLYFGNRRVFETSDGGAHWAVISPDLTRPDPARPANLDDAAAADNLGVGARRGVLYSIAPSRTANDGLWVGTDDGLVWYSGDAGKHWRDVTPRRLTAWSKIAGIDASHFDAATAYIAVDRHRLDDDRPYIYRTHDGGRTWTPIVAGIADRDFVNVVREDDRRAGLLYAGTEHGIYVSFDDGDHWQSLQLDLPVTSVRDIDVHGDDLVIATHGRGFYILDDAAPLRQLTPAVAAAQVWLFTPASAVRLRMPDFLGTPLPAEEPKAANPPDGAYIDYALRESQRGPVTLQIRDAHGALVRRWSSAAPAPAAKSAQIDFAPEWAATPAHLSAAAGAHRFVWNFTYAPPAALTEADAVWAPPGAYSASLTVRGRTSTARFSILADPRVHLDPRVYRRQFLLARRIDRWRADVAQAAARLQQLRGAVAAAPAGTCADAAAPAGACTDAAAGLDAFAARLTRIAGTRTPANPADVYGFPPTTPQSFGFVEAALKSLFVAVDGADAAPSRDALAGWRRLRPMAAELLARERAVIGHDLPQVNRRRRAAGLAPIEAPAAPAAAGRRL